MVTVATDSLLSERDIWNYLEEVFDPEVPVLSVVDLGIIRSIQLNNGDFKVVITPTYSGCPAMNTIETDIRTKLTEKGVTHFTVNTVLAPAWTTEWMSEEGRRKLKEYGIAPPFLSNDGTGSPQECPNCGSKETELKSEFGSTACKALYVCDTCKEPFDYFKCH